MAFLILLLFASFSYYNWFNVYLEIASQNVILVFGMCKYINKYIGDACLANFRSLIATKVICLDIALLLVVIHAVSREGFSLHSFPWDQGLRAKWIRVAEEQLGRTLSAHIALFKVF